MTTRTRPHPAGAEGSAESGRVSAEEQLTGTSRAGRRRARGGWATPGWGSLRECGGRRLGYTLPLVIISTMQK